MTLEIVRKIVDQFGFVVLPRRWAIERFFAWDSRNRRLSKDVEATIADAVLVHREQHRLRGRTLTEVQESA